jgi:hypothetical protein
MSAVPEVARMPSSLPPVAVTEDFESFARFGDYIGDRVGITESGDWSFFVVGD